MQVDATVLQHQNQKLLQQIDVQKHELHELEVKIKELKDKQYSYDDVLIVVNQLWNQVDSWLSCLVALSFRTLLFYSINFAVPVEILHYFVVQLVDDLILLGVRAGAGQIALELLDHADHCRGIFFHFYAH